MNRVPAILLFLTSSAFAAAAEAPMDPSDDFSPFLFLMALLAILVMLIVLGICLAVAVVTAICLMILVALGILSTAALTGIIRRKFSSGLRALHYQACAAVALPVGAALAWLGVQLFDSTSHLPVALAVGSVAGICAGLTIAFILDRAAVVIYSHFEKLRSKKARIEQTPPPATS